MEEGHLIVSKKEDENKGGDLMHDKKGTKVKFNIIRTSNSFIVLR